jgi:DNA-binding transcriptional regulator PaaX
MQPFERFKKLNTEGNLWIYVLLLGKEKEIRNDEVGRLIFENFGFLSGRFLLRSVLYRLRKEGYVSDEKFMGKRAYKTTKKGIKELENLKNFYQNLIEKLESRQKDN